METNIKRQKQKENLNVLLLWIFLRIITSAIAAVTSSIKPMTSAEMRIQLLPPSVPILQWLDRVFLSPWLRWDAEWYTRIITQGYSAADGTAQFHPLYAWLATPMVKIGISPVFSLLIVSSAASLGLYYAFYKLARLDLNINDTFYALMLFTFAPPAFILFAPYPEALFLLFAVLCLYLVRQNKWWLGCIFGGLASLTRQQGVFLLIPATWELWEKSDRLISNFSKQVKDYLSLTLIPLGFIAWVVYRAIFLADAKINFENIQGFIYSLLISPSAAKVVEDQQFLWPWQSIYLSLTKLFSQPDLDIWINIIAGVLFLALLIISWKKIRQSYRLYSLFIYIISFSYYTGVVHPYMGLPRHLYLAFPIYIGLASIINKPWQRLMMIGLFTVGMTFLLGMYVLHTWVP